MSAALRIEQHQIAINYMSQQYHFKSIETLQSAYLKHGPHVGLLSDLIACLFVNGRHFDCQNLFKKLLSEFHFAKNSLSDVSQINTLIFISKMHEELGEITESIAAIEQAVTLVDMKPKYQDRVFSNYLRIATTYTDLKKLNIIYQSCLKSFNDRSAVQAEVEHSIIIAELHLFEIKAASVRISNFLSNLSYNAEDRKFLLFDIAEFCICENISNPYVDQLKFFKQATDLTLFENTILNIVFKRQALSTCESAESNFFDQLRVYRMLSAAADPENCRVLLKKINFSMESLDYKNKTIIKKKWLLILSDKHIASSHIDVNNSELQKNKLFKYFHEHLSVEKFISFDQFCVDFFGEELSLSHYDRIRIAVRRLNEKIKKISGIDKTFHVTKNSIEVFDEKIIFK